ncbi:MAG: metalloregulator ArsR/SmtB family transcription factor [Pyrinomonadaceae bacterium]
MTTKTYHMELLFKALADKTRLRLINLMGGDEVCVCFFVEVLKTNQPKISRHLAYLRRAGAVAARREGKWMHYRVVTPPDAHAARVFNEIRAWLSENHEMQQDRARFVKVCCAPQPPVHLRAAPRPAGLSVEGCQS